MANIAMYVILLLVLSACVRGVYLCNIKICLTWTIQKDKLELLCKVNCLKFGVEFYNNKHNEQAYCVSPLPSPKCLSLQNDTKITQNATTNETYLKIIAKIDSSFNGQWECRHGTETDKAIVNVTVLRSDTAEAKLNGGQCWKSYVSYTMVGFGITTFIGTLIHIFCLRCCNCYSKRDIWCNLVNSCLKRLRIAYHKDDMHRMRVLKFWKIVVFLILILILFMVPVGKGFKDGNICRDEEWYLILGVSLSAVLCVILSTRLKRVTKSEECDNEMSSMSIDEDTNTETSPLGQNQATAENEHQTIDEIYLE